MEHEYIDLLRDILDTGYTKMDRTGTGTIGVFGRQIRCDLANGFPLLTTKEISWKAVAHELLWFLAGDTNIRYLCQNGVNIWADWPYKHYCQTLDSDMSTLYTKYTRKEFIQCIIEDEAFAKRWGDCGPIYSRQWRKWYSHHEYNGHHAPNDVWHKLKHDYNDDLYEGDFRPVYVDQIQQLVDGLKNNPLSRRHIVNAWNPADIEEMAVSGLPPCHFVFQCNARPLTVKERLAVCDGPGGGEIKTVGIPFNGPEEMQHSVIDKIGVGFTVPRYALDLHINIRSNDMGLGAPYNIASYAMLIHMLAQQVNMVPGELVYTVGDAHIYLNHVEKLREQISRTPGLPPMLKLRKAASIFDYTIDDFEIVGYDPMPAIKLEVAV